MQRIILSCWEGEHSGAARGVRFGIEDITVAGDVLKEESLDAESAQGKVFLMVFIFQFFKCYT